MIKRLLCILILLSLLTGCAEKEGEKEAPPAMNGDDTLVRVEYYVSSQMEHGKDFSIDVTPEKINSAYIFTERDLEYLSVEDSAITDAQWKAINEAVLVIAPRLEIETTSEKTGYSANFPLPLDGNDSSSFYMTWETTDGEVRVHYQIPNDRRFFTLVDILRETADPIGREIEYYDEPVLEGIYFRRESLLPFNKYSYQCSAIKEDTDELYFAAYYYDGGSASYTATVYADTWNRIADKCKELSIEELETGSADRKPICTLYYSDETQRKVVLDGSTAKELRAFFDHLVADLKEETE